MEMCTDDEKKWQLAAHGKHPSIANSRRNITTIFSGTFEIFIVFEPVYVYISRFLTENLTMFHGTRVGK